MLGFGCNNDGNEVEYPIEPNIEFISVEFIKSNPDIHSSDTIKVTFNFTDGDMDLGLDPLEYDSPYHRLSFYTLSDNGELFELSSKEFYPDLSDYSKGYLINSSPAGKLATKKLSDQMGKKYDHLVIPCLMPSTYLKERESHLIDSTFNLDTLELPPGERIFMVKDTLLTSINPNSFNLEVEYLIKQPDGTFETFDWLRQFCTTFNGRFGNLRGLKRGKNIGYGTFLVVGYSTQSGTIKYSMPSIGFRYLFANNSLKLRIKIRDRALHESNVIETTEFTVD